MHDDLTREEQLKLQTAILREILVEFRIYNNRHFGIRTGSTLQESPAQIRERVRIDVNARITRAIFADA